MPLVTGSPARPTRAVSTRFTLVTIGAPVGGVFGHLAGGGTSPTSFLAVLGVLILGAATTGGAIEVSRRSRGSWAPWGVLLAGQAAMEAVLRFPGSPSTLLSSGSSGVHILAAVVLTALLLGGERVAGDLRDLLDRWMPRSWADLPLIEFLATAPCEGPRSLPLGRTEHLPRTPRGPPHD